MIAHIVLFRPKGGVTVDQKKSFAQALMVVGRDVPEIRRAFVGRSVAVDSGYHREFGDTTYPYAAVMEFEDREGLVAYLNHPSHRELGRLFWETCEATTIVEVETADLGQDLGDVLV